MITFLCAVVSLFFYVSISHGQGINTQLNKTNFNNVLPEKIGNFSIELLYHTTKQHRTSLNMIISPVTAWSLLAVIAEGASGTTLREISSTLRITPSKRAQTREHFKSILQWSEVTNNTAELEIFNGIFIDVRKLPLRDFADVANEYNAKIVTADFTEPEHTATIINKAIAVVTHGHIPNIVISRDLVNSPMIMTSVLYFKGQWTVAFNSLKTSIQPFYSSTGTVIGEVNMMYNRHTYPYANIHALQALVIEIPYGTENRLSMLIMLPNPGLSITDMFLKFINVSLETVFNELKISAEEYGEDEIDCFIPRFKIETNLDLTDRLKYMGILDLFDEKSAFLPLMARTPMYASKYLHKAVIEVTEEGTTPPAASVAESNNRVRVARFEANRPFCYLIVEKMTNSIIFGGFYRLPSLF